MRSSFSYRVTGVCLFSFCCFITSLSQAGTCKKVHAELEEVQVIDGCDSPNKFCAAGTIDGNHGLQGTTYFVMDGGVLGPATSPGTIAYSGLFEITTRDGTLLLRESGITKSRPENPDGGIFASFAEVVSGSGNYEGTTGEVYFNGTSKDGLFRVTMRGKLCGG